MAATIAVIACTFFVSLLLISEKRQDVRLKWLTKPAASASFIALALACGALSSSYGLWILVALFLCFWGDVLLIPRHEKLFLAGMGAFAAGHVAFVVAFLLNAALRAPLFIAALVASALFITLVLRWLWPHLGSFKWPVVGYCIIIGAMVSTSPLAAPHGVPLVPGIMIGAILFAISDIFVAREQFVTQAFVNRLWGLPLYYGAQMLLASSV